MSEQTVKCKICGNPYVVYMHYAGDQSACQSCRDKARSGGKHDSVVNKDNIYNDINYYPGIH